MGSESNKLPVAVIGVGALGRHHARILAEMEGVDLVAVVDPNAEQARSVAQQHNTTWVTDYQDILDKCQAVSLVAPTFLHHKIAADCLKAGKDILVEKPITADLRQARDLCELAEQTDAILQVGHIERFNPAFEQVAESLTSVPRYIRAERLSPFPFRSMDIGVVHDLMIHDIELVLHLTGAMPTSVEAFGSRIMGAHEDMAQARLTFPNGCTADITSSRIHPTASRSLHVWSNTECLSANLHTREVTCARPSSQLVSGPAMEDRLRNGEDVNDLKSRVFGEFIEIDNVTAPQIDQLTAELSEFVNCVKNRTWPRVTGEQGLRAVKVAEQVLSSLMNNCVNARSTETSLKWAA